MSKLPEMCRMGEPEPEYLEVIENEYSDRNTKLELVAPEFTCLCPEKPSQPDFATFIIEYVPGEYIVELKALKLYLTSYRNVEIYHEPVTNLILDDLVEACSPRWMRITGMFNTRGGITTDVTVEYGELDESEIPESQSTRTEELTRIQSEQ
jgi:7-cyano-7-deazaguanine reductase